jgi:hypothetical protein
MRVRVPVEETAVAVVEGAGSERMEPATEELELAEEGGSREGGMRLKPATAVVVELALVLVLALALVLVMVLEAEVEVGALPAPSTGNVNGWAEGVAAASAAAFCCFCSSAYSADRAALSRIL